MDLEETTISSSRIYDGRVINLRVDRVALPDGRETSREVVEHRGAVVVVAMDQAGHVAMVRQYRYPLGQVTLELPAGTLEPGEDPLTSAQRELREETGLAATAWEALMACYSSPGFCTEKMHFFLARVSGQTAQATDADENIEVVRLPLAEAVRRVEAGEINDAKTALGILAVARRTGVEGLTL
ncbi:MAG: NUDIX hydrolase [Clostridia bacterium]|nr:MAG: NUDIX hydrolase [Clostridia bacterium]